MIRHFRYSKYDVKVCDHRSTGFPLSGYLRPSFCQGHPGATPGKTTNHVYWKTNTFKFFRLIGGLNG